MFFNILRSAQGPSISMACCWFVLELFLEFFQGYLCQDTARKTIFSFWGRPEKMVFPKKCGGIWFFLYYWER